MSFHTGNSLGSRLTLSSKNSGRPPLLSFPVVRPSKSCTCIFSTYEVLRYPCSACDVCFVSNRQHSPDTSSTKFQNEHHRQEVSLLPAPPVEGREREAPYKAQREVESHDKIVEPRPVQHDMRTQQLMFRPQQAPVLSLMQTIGEGHLTILQSQMAANMVKKVAKAS